MKSKPTGRKNRISAVQQQYYKAIGLSDAALGAAVSAPKQVARENTSAYRRMRWGYHSTTQRDSPLLQVNLVLQLRHTSLKENFYEESQ